MKRDALRPPARNRDSPLREKMSVRFFGATGASRWVTRAMPRFDGSHREGWPRSGNYGGGLPGLGGFCWLTKVSFSWRSRRETITAMAITPAARATIAARKTKAKIVKSERRPPGRLNPPPLEFFPLPDPLPPPFPFTVNIADWDCRLAGCELSDTSRRTVKLPVPEGLQLKVFVAFEVTYGLIGGWQPGGVLFNHA